MALTWRNVDAPDFRSSMDGIRSFADLFGNAISGAERGLARYDASLDRRANNEFGMNLLKYQDPVAYKAALASGTIFSGVDPKRISAASIQAADARSAALLGQRVAEFGLERDQYGFDRLQSRDTARDAFTPLLPAAQKAQVNGKFDEFVAANSQFNALSFDDANAITNRTLENEKTGVGITADRVGIDNTKLNMDRTRQDMRQGATRFNWEADDRETANQVEAALQGMDLNTFDGPSAEIWLRSQNFSPKVYNAIRNRIPALGGGGSSDGVGSGSFSPPNGDFSNVPFAAVKDMIGGREGPENLGGYGAIAYNTGNGRNAAGVPTPSKPLTEMTLGEVYDFQRGPMRQATRGYRGPKDVGSTGVGKYQFESGTLAENAEKAFGSNWRTQKFDAQTQDRIAETLFDRVKGNRNQLNNTWAAFQNVPSTGSLQMGQTSVAVGQAQAAQKRNGDGSVSPEYTKLIQDRRPVGAIISEMKKGSIYKDRSENELLEMIQLVQATADKNGTPMTAALAADILERSPQASNPGFLQRGMNAALYPFTPFKPGISPDKNRVGSIIADYAKGRGENSVMADADAAIVNQGAQQMAGQLQQAEARLAQAMSAQARGVRIDIRPYQAQVAQLRIALSAGQSAIEADRSRTVYNGPRKPGNRQAGYDPANDPMAKSIAERRRAMWLGAVQGTPFQLR